MLAFAHQRSKIGMESISVLSDEAAYLILHHRSKVFDSKLHFGRLLVGWARNKAIVLGPFATQASKGKQ